MDTCTAHNHTTECTVGKHKESMVPPVLQFLGGFIGNTLAIFTIIKSAKSHKWKSFYRLVFALSLTDATVSCLVYPIVLKRYISHFKYCFSEYECHHVAFFYSFAFLGSALLVTSMSLDRFIAIVFPLYYKRDLRIRRTTILISSSWILAASICALPIIGVGKVKLYYPESWCFINFISQDTNNKIVTYIYAILGVIIFLITAFVNITVVITLIRRSIQSKKKFGIQKRSKSDIYIVIFLLGIVLVFSVCWIPLIARMLYNIHVKCPVDGQTDLLVARLAITNSIVDPWIYIVLRKENLEYIEDRVKGFLSRASGKTEKVRNGTSVLTMKCPKRKENSNTPAAQQNGNNKAPPSPSLDSGQERDKKNIFVISI